jgi:hypothetical protein
MKCDVCKTEYAAVKSVDITAPQVQPQSSGPGFPLLKYDHLFRSQAELDDYERRVAEREANLDGSDAVKQAELQPGAQDVRTFDVPQLEWVLQNINAVLSNHGATHGPMKALHELSALMQASGITDAGNGYIVPPASFPQLSALTVQRAKELAGLA